MRKAPTNATASSVKHNPQAPKTARAGTGHLASPGAKAVGRSPGRSARASTVRSVDSRSPASLALDTLIPTLTRENALEIAMAEMEGRYQCTGGENDERLSLLHALVNRISVAGLQDKLSTINSSAMHTIRMMQKDEAVAMAHLTAEFEIEKMSLRRVAVGDVGSAAVYTLVDQEALQRKKMDYLEDRTFIDVMALEKALRFNSNEDERYEAIRQHAQGLHCVRLFDGCPFINPRHCPFHSADWIDPKSLVQQHFQRKYPRLKYDRRATERTYAQIVNRRYERLQNVDCRLFVSRMEKGLSPSTA
jgi:hypothetical protein